MSQDLCRGAEAAIRQCTAIAKTNFLNTSVSWGTEAAFVLLLINLKDVLLALHSMQERISFREDVLIDGDVTDLVRELRNAAAHNGSVLRMFDPTRQNSLHFGVLIGAGTLIKFADGELSNPYDDDVAFFYGRLRILLVRHIHRAIREADAALDRCSAVHGYHRFRI